MRMTKDGRFYKREVDRSIPDVVHYVVYMGVGRHFHACKLDRLYEHMVLKARYKNLNKEEFKTLIRRTDGAIHKFWKISVSDDDVVTVV